MSRKGASASSSSSGADAGAPPRWFGSDISSGENLEDDYELIDSELLGTLSVGCEELPSLPVCQVCDFVISLSLSPCLSLSLFAEEISLK